MRRQWMIRYEVEVLGALSTSDGSSQAEVFIAETSVCELDPEPGIPQMPKGSSSLYDSLWCFRAHAHPAASTLSSLPRIPYT